MLLLAEKQRACHDRFDQRTQAVVIDRRPIDDRFDLLSIDEFDRRTGSVGDQLLDHARCQLPWLAGDKVFEGFNVGELAAVGQNETGVDRGASDLLRYRPLSDIARATGRPDRNSPEHNRADRSSRGNLRTRLASGASPIAHEWWLRRGYRVRSPARCRAAAELRLPATAWPPKLRESRATYSCRWRLLSRMAPCVNQPAAATLGRKRHPAQFGARRCRQSCRIARADC